ncbi:MAG: hypothetical protein RIR79_1922 [Pseudomonadota bacterium]|jgi:tetratricopeptide (TPR) repeat protein
MQPTQQQEARADGNGNIIIQIVGDGNTVVSGYPDLALTRYATPPAIESDLERLSPYSRSIPLVGRATELADLWQFLENPKPIQARVLIGGGGSGKTRLAIELCEEAIAKGWAAGLVGRDEFHRFRTQQNASTWGWNKPTLLVIDYAAGLYEELSSWLNELIQKQKAPTHPLRILLLERSASADAGWFHTVFYSGGYSAAGKQKLLNPPFPVELAPLQQVSDRRALLQSMLPNQLSADDGDFEAHLMGLEWGGDPLFLMMAALEMERTGNSNVLTLGRAELALQVAGHERERITRIARAKNVDETLVHHLAACVTLAQGVAPKALLEFANTEKSAIGRDAGSSAPLVDALRMALGKQKTIEPIRPDLIGEAYIVLAMRALEDDELSMEAVQRCYANFGNKVVESVVRCVMDFSPDEKSPLVWMEGLIQANWDNSVGLQMLDMNVPMDSVALRDIQLEIAQRRLELKGNELTPSRAGALNNVATALSKLGKREEALAAAQEAVSIRRTLAATRPDVFNPDLAMSLNNVANVLSELGKREEALAAAQEAVSIRRTLAATRPDVFNPDLAMSLNNVANRLSDLGQREEALAAAREAVKLYKTLAATRPDVFNPYLAGSLNNVASFLSALGKREEALAAAQEAVELYKTLAATRPDVFNPDLAMSLSNVALRLSDLGQREEALAAAQEAVKLYKTLAATRPDVFKPDLARSLIVLALRYEEMGNLAKACQFAHEAVSTLQASFMQRPFVHQRLMVFILQTYTRQCQAAGIPADAGLINPLIPILQQLQTKEQTHA